jgi:hypothetical protein
MQKLTAILCVVSWSGFWAFGYLALSIGDFSSNQLSVAALLAFVGLITGLTSYLHLVRLSEASGYAKHSNQLDAAARHRAHQEGSH